MGVTRLVAASLHYEYLVLPFGKLRGIRMERKKQYNTIQKQKKFRKQDGIALISIVLLTALVLASIVGITATLALSTKRTTKDQMMVLRAQYAAESGLALAKLRLGELEDIVNLAEYPNSLITLDTHAEEFCGKRLSPPTTDVANWTTNQLINGFEICSANAINSRGASTNRLSILNDYITQADLQSLGITTTAADFWDEVFTSTLTATQILQANSEGSVRFEIDFNMQPKAVRLLQDQISMRFVFGLGNIVAKGIIEDPNGQILATRKLELSPSASEMFLEISKPSFAQYGYFAENRFSPTSGRLIYFNDSQVIGGRVHVNDAVGINADTSTGGPRFSGKFSTTASEITWNRGSYQVAEELMFLAGNEFGAQSITLPDNNHIQRDKALGVASVTNNNDICAALNLGLNSPSCANHYDGAQGPDAEGIFYAYGDGADTPNIIDPDEFRSLVANLLNSLLGPTLPVNEPTWFGGIYVKGDVNNIVLSTTNAGNQSILIEHSNGSKAEFLQVASTTWEVLDTDIAGNETRGLLTGKAFNGLLYVDGEIGCYERRDGNRESGSAPSSNDTCDDRTNGLKGDGTDNPDLHKSFMLTITATSHITIKEDLTYAALPFCVDDEDFDFNVLGLFSSGGNIEVDGPSNSDITVHASIMASGEEKGFGTLVHGRGRGGDANINIIGGVISHTDQAVGTFGYGGGTGYGRNWEFDCRLENGLAPPFFPTQLEWDKRTSFIGLNNRAVWRLN